MVICQHDKLYVKGLAMVGIHGRNAQAVEGLQQYLRVTDTAIFSADMLDLLLVLL